MRDASVWLTSKLERFEILGGREDGAVEHRLRCERSSRCAPEPGVEGPVASGVSRREVRGMTCEGAVTNAMTEIAIGVTTGRYTFTRYLGSGGMGVVYAARDHELERDVAIKVLRDTTTDLGTLRREALAMARISDPAVVHVYEIGAFETRPYVAMELVEGMSLREWRRDNRSWREVTRVMLAVGRGLVAAHRANVVHRDVKPENILIGRDGRACLVDFGLARGFERSEDGECAGTPAYMAPEQHLGRAVTPASDQFGFCVTFWEILFEQRPFARSPSPDIPTAPAFAVAIINHQIQNAEHHRGVPRWLVAILRRGLAVEPERRWPALAELLNAIEQGLRRSVRRRRWLLVAIGVAISAVAVRPARERVRSPTTKQHASRSPPNARPNPAFAGTDRWSSRDAMERPPRCGSRHQRVRTTSERGRGHRSLPTVTPSPRSIGRPCSCGHSTVQVKCVPSESRRAGRHGSETARSSSASEPRCERGRSRPASNAGSASCQTVR
jgi:serine/threonine protein kinase